MFSMKRIEIEDLKDQIKTLEQKIENRDVKINDAIGLIRRFLAISKIDSGDYWSRLLDSNFYRITPFRTYIEALEKAAVDKAESERIEAIVRSYLQRTDPSGNV